MKGIAIGFSDTSKEILKRLKKTEFINEIYKENIILEIKKYILLSICWEEFKITYKLIL